jgi:hypothetical protein
MATAVQEKDTAIAAFLIPNKFAICDILRYGLQLSGHAYRRLKRTIWW